jgi:hypothetical protein
MKTAFTVLNFILKSVVALAVVFSILLLFSDSEDRQYLRQESVHYKGESTVTNYQAIYLVANYKVWDITKFESTGDDAVQIEYNFYGEKNLDYLAAMPHSFWDTPFFGDATVGVRVIWPLFLGLLLLMMIAVFLFVTRRGNNLALFLYNRVWYVVHPEYLFKTKDQIEHRFDRNIVDSIKIADDQAGIIAIRTWKYSSQDGFLHSTSRGQAWREKVIYTDNTVDVKNTSGLYAFRLGTVKLNYSSISDIVGIVALSGDWTEHEDEVIRAERCEMLCLIISTRVAKLAGHLSALYGVPIIVKASPINYYKHWVLGLDGVKWLAHNAEILKEEIKWEPEKELSGKVESLARNPLKFQS